MVSAFDHVDAWYTGLLEGSRSEQAYAARNYCGRPSILLVQPSCAVFLPFPVSPATYTRKLRGIYHLLYSNLAGNLPQQITYRVHPPLVHHRFVLRPKVGSPSASVTVGLVLPSRSDMALKQENVTARVELAGRHDVVH